MVQYKSPKGDPIIGTSETVEATAYISGIDDSGQPIYLGESRIHWDTQITNENKKGQILFICESGDIWTFDQLERSQ